MQPTLRLDRLHKVALAVRDAITGRTAFTRRGMELQVALYCQLPWEEISRGQVRHLRGSEQHVFGINLGPQALTVGAWYMKDRDYLYELRCNPMQGDEWEQMEGFRTPLTERAEALLEANHQHHRAGLKLLGLNFTRPRQGPKL